MSKLITAVVVGLLLALGSIQSAYAQTPIEIRLAIFTDIIEAIGAAGDAMVKITDGIKHMIVTGASGYNHAAAERERSRLKDLSARGTTVRGIQVYSTLVQCVQNVQVVQIDSGFFPTA